MPHCQQTPPARHHHSHPRAPTASPSVPRPRYPPRITFLNYIRLHRACHTSEQNDKAVWELSGLSAPVWELGDFVS